MFDPSEYQSPEWQKKRLEVMEAAQWTCQCCGENTKQLQVHHRQYKKGSKIWEYDADELICVCDKCHEGIHHFISQIGVIASYFSSEKLERSMEMSDDLVRMAMNGDCVYVRHLLNMMIDGVALCVLLRKENRAEEK